MNIDIIRERVEAKNYLIKSHAVQHALKEGFERAHIVEAILNGKMIEAYPEVKRVLICGRTTLSIRFPVYLHAVCEHADPVYIEIVTAYIPKETQWESPPFRRRGRRRR